MASAGGDGGEGSLGDGVGRPEFWLLEDFYIRLDAALREMEEVLGTSQGGTFRDVRDNVQFERFRRELWPEVDEHTHTHTHSYTRLGTPLLQSEPVPCDLT